MRRQDAGITLLEVLLALAVMAMLGVGIGSLFETGSQVWQRIDANSEVADHAINRTELRSTLESMQVVGPDLPLSELIETDDGIAFAIEKDGISIWQRVRLSENALLWQVDSAPTSQILRPDLSRVTFSYYGRKTVRSEPDWHTNWDDATILPVLIKIESWQIGGQVNPPLTIQPAKLTRQMEISLSSLVPPD
ncbi:prepilin-type N-terminal cleavage/methylation domain-containing protein [Cognatiyoonia sp. IB215182]|uniref:prepilin-type N-terminal cleavage/methylation domain-containing protein n=1 Tax=Cognatiyoonia sp. IB215182 TaxID=3097353 RepID=UPI002A117665|nr:prepilin-type N-terminal cleavage/methylation domain-containing protein [Cognatiyoonia sp. IB215182]MDX8355264.1 prepilin-type N-terminal cleavage/methylation domain-containing protein [Cognatiyoonia sp. IB215182]